MSGLWIDTIKRAKRLPELEMAIYCGGSDDYPSCPRTFLRFSKGTSDSVVLDSRGEGDHANTIP